jgi:hypothetical protein
MERGDRWSTPLTQWSNVSTESDRVGGLVGLAKTQTQLAQLPNRPTWVAEAHRHLQIVFGIAQDVRPTLSDR